MQINKSNACNQSKDPSDFQLSMGSSHEDVTPPAYTFLKFGDSYINPQSWKSPSSERIPLSPFLATVRSHQVFLDPGLQSQDGFDSFPFREAGVLEWEKHRLHCETWFQTPASSLTGSVTSIQLLHLCKP